MTLDALLRPGGRPAKAFVMALAFSFLTIASSILVALQIQDYLWGFTLVAASIYTPLIILGLAYGIGWIGGARLSPIVTLALAVVLGCFLAQVVNLYISEEWCDLRAPPEKTYMYKLLYAREYMLAWGMGFAAWYMTRRMDMRAAELGEAETAGSALQAYSAEARLQALQAQVEPHFLFNTLAHVKWLYRRDPRSGRRMLERFLDYLRAALPRMRQATTTLEQEIELARAYLDIQQLRIGQRLEFDIEIPEGVGGHAFPPLMLITLVENAIKHGIAPQVGGGTIRICAGADERVLRIEVRDTGAGLKQGGGSGIGLANVRARLAALFGSAARLVVEPNVPHGVVSAIEIPR
jgi:signal transduction histidine kinase